MNKTSTIFGFCIAIVVLLCIVIYALRGNLKFGKKNTERVEPAAGEAA